MSKFENPFVCFLPQLPSLLPVVSGTRETDNTKISHFLQYTSGKLITDINQNLLIVVLEMEKVCHFLSELINNHKQKDFNGNKFRLHLGGHSKRYMYM